MLIPRIIKEAPAGARGHQANPDLATLMFGLDVEILTQ
jgi:hypothetical protein